MCLSKKNTVRREFFSTIETIEEYTHARSFSSALLTLHPQVHLDPYLAYQGKTVPVSGDVGALLPAFAVPFGILFSKVVSLRLEGCLGFGLSSMEFFLFIPTWRELFTL